MNNFLEWDKLEFRKSSGKEKLRCPSCDYDRSDKKDKSLQINHNDGLYKLGRTTRNYLITWLNTLKIQEEYHKQH